jgi:sugar lactone lactonase YvrE
VQAVRSVLGEGPLWDPEEQCLYWVDILSHLIHRYDPASQERTSYDVGLPVGAIGLRAAGGLVLATLKGFAFWCPQDPELEYIADPEAGRSDTRFNDGAVDRRGRFWAGTMALDPKEYDLAKGSLYRMDADHSVHMMIPGLTISNGIGWSPDDRTMYLTDTMRRVIYAYDFDPASGGVERRRAFVETPDGEGYPDGLTVDSEGFVWSARFAGSKIVRYDPAGRMEREIELPVSCPTSCAFGGPDLDVLYITTSHHMLTEEDKSDQPFAGELLKLDVGIRGLSEARFQG